LANNSDNNYYQERRHHHHQYQDLTADEILSIHREVEAQFPSIYRGVQKPGLLESIAARPSQKHYNEEHFPDIYWKCASLIEAIIQWHPFFDGNKRTGLLVASYYMYKNKFMLLMPLWAVRFSVLVADHKKNLEDIRRWVEMLAADNAVEYFAKSEQLLTDPIDRILSFLERGRIGHDAVAFRRAHRVIDNWLAIDIYPEYKMEDVETIGFLRQLTSRFGRFPFWG
jgi:death-on-curing protein